MRAVEHGSLEMLSKLHLCIRQRGTVCIQPEPSLDMFLLTKKRKAIVYLKPSLFLSSSKPSASLWYVIAISLASSISLFLWRPAAHLERPVSGSAHPSSFYLAATKMLIIVGQSPKTSLSVYPQVSGRHFLSPSSPVVCLLSLRSFGSRDTPLVCSLLQPMPSPDFITW